MGLTGNTIYQWDSQATLFINGTHRQHYLSMGLTGNIIYQWDSQATLFINGTHGRVVEHVDVGAFERNELGPPALPGQAVVQDALAHPAHVQHVLV